MKNTILKKKKKKQHLAKREKKNGKSVKFKRGRMLAEKVNYFPVLYYKQVKGYKERDVVTNAWDTVASDFEFAVNGKIICFAFLVKALF